jgi:putative ABC transport system permease protein
LVVADAAFRSSQLAEDQTHRFGAAAARLTIAGSSETDLPIDLPELVAGQLPADVTAQWGNEVRFIPLRNAARPDDVVTADISTLDMTTAMAAGIAEPTEGRLPADEREVFLSDQLADAFGVRVGDVLQLVRPQQSFEVVGTGNASGYYRLMVAPGFDLEVLRPGIAQPVALLGPTLREGSFESLTFDFGSTDMFVDIERPTVAATDYLALFLGWVFSIMLMAVLGIVVSAAFAVSGRRQLVTIGQLSASGTDQAVLRRYLALQGTWSGAVGVVAGVGLGLGLLPFLDSVVANDGRTAIGGADIAVIVAVALTTATLAAIVPTRDLARTSVLAALGGRRPVGSVRPHQVRLGVFLIAGGSTALWLAVSSARDSASFGGGMGASVALAGAGGLAMLAGMCCVCPVVVDVVARVGSRRRGATRLATRSLGRHRARSAALVAAIAAIGAAAVAAGATAEHEFSARGSQSYMHLDRIELSSFELAPPSLPDQSAMPTEVAKAVDPSILAEVEAVVGDVSWLQARQVGPTESVPSPLLVADEALLDLLHLTPGQRAALAEVDVALIEPEQTNGMSMSGSHDFGPLEWIVLTSEVDQSRAWAVVTPEAVERFGLETIPSATFGILDHEITRGEYDDLVDLNSFTNETAYFLAVPSGEVGTNVGFAFPETDYSAMARLIILGGMLLLTTLVVGVGMALWAAEGKDERDALVSLGAPPATMARVVGIKAWLLAFVGGAIAVPLGFGTLRLAVAAAGESTTFPWLVAVGLVVLVPLLIGATATLGSAVAQRARPVRMSTLAGE